MDESALADTTAPVVSGYDVGRCLGRGGSAAVWLATQRSTGRQIALKCFLSGAGSDNDTSEESVRHEIRVLSILDHEHLVRAYDVVKVAGRESGGLGVTMDYAPGGSLAQVLASRGTLGPGETVTVLTPIAQALAYLHAQGFTHGDVSPGNILFTAHGKPLLADLGMARMVADAEAVAGAGTEGFRDPAPVDAVRAGLQPERDVYSLAALGWYCLTGRPPEHGAQRPPLPLLVPGVSPALTAALESALQEDRRLRPSATELAAAIHGSAPAEPVDLSVSVHPTVIPHLLTRRAVPASSRERRAARLRALLRHLRHIRAAGASPARVSVRARPLSRASGNLSSTPAAQRGRAGTVDSGRHSAGRRPDGRGLSRVVAPGRPPVRRFAEHPGHRVFRPAAVVMALLGLLAAGWTFTGAALPASVPGTPGGQEVPARDAGATEAAGPGGVAPAADASDFPAEVLAQLAAEDPGEAVRGLARVRSQALNSGDFGLLKQVNVPASEAAAADDRLSAALRETGCVLAGFDTILTRVATESVAGDGEAGKSRAVVAATITTPVYQERDAGGRVRSVTPAVPEQRVRLVLTPVEGHWKIQDILPAGTPDPAGADGAGTPGRR